MASAPLMGTEASFKQIRDEIDAEQHKRETQYLLPTLMDQQTVKLDEEFYRGICDKLEDCAEDQHGQLSSTQITKHYNNSTTICNRFPLGLDIYQVTSFYKHYHPNHGGSTEYYIFSILKALICCGIQTVGMCAFLYNAFILNTDAMVCTLNKPWEVSGSILNL